MLIKVWLKCIFGVVINIKMVDFYYRDIECVKLFVELLNLIKRKYL